VTKLYLVTDPMCSWCWGMAADFADAQAQLADLVEFDLILGGINTHGTQPVGAYGRRYLVRLWQEVEATTGQNFGYQFPAEYVHNSTLPCVAIEAVRVLTEQVPFDFLRNLQEQFFVHAEDINNRQTLLREAEKIGVSAAQLAPLLTDAKLLERVRFQFEHATAFGTQALPSLLIEEAGDARLKLFAGGFVDAQMLVSLVQARLQA